MARRLTQSEVLELLAKPPQERTKSEVLALRNSGPASGCCNRFMDQMVCSCLANALPDEDDAKRVPVQQNSDAELLKLLDAGRLAVQIELIRAAVHLTSLTEIDKDLADEATGFLVRQFAAQEK